MGLNTTLFLLNDQLPVIAKDVKLGELIAAAVNGGDQDDQGLKPIGNGVYVIETHHNDETAIVAVGGNTARVLGFVRTEIIDIVPDEQKVEIALKQLIERKGMHRTFEEHFGRAPQKKLSREEMNEFVKKEYGCRMIVLRDKKQKDPVKGKITVTRKKL
jgi:hypothetical protein